MIYEPSDINEILSILSSPTTTKSKGATTNIMKQIKTDIEQLQSAKDSIITKTTSNKQEGDALQQQLRETNHNITEQDALVNARLDSVASNIESNSKSIKQIQSELSQMTKRIEDIHLLMTEEKKDDGLDEMRKKMETMEQNIQNIMNMKSESNNKQNSKQEAVKKWLKDKVELPQYFDVFIENGFESLDIIKEIQSEQDLNQMGIDKLGHKRKIMKEINAPR